MLRCRGASYVEFTTTTPVDGQVVLRLVHLTSGVPTCPNGGYAPVDLSINGAVVLNDFDVAENHGGSHSYENDVWLIGGLPADTFVFRIALDSHACSNYWIQLFTLDLVN